MDNIVDKASHVFLVLSGILIVVMMFSATYGVVRRYAFDSPEPYSYEISTMFLLFSFVFAISAVEKLGRHIRVDFVSSRLPERAQHVILNIVAPIMGLFFVYMLTWKGVGASRVGRSAISTIIADFPNRQDAETWYRDNTARLPSDATAVLFGQTLLLALPAADDEAREHWFNELDTR